VSTPESITFNHTVGTTAPSGQLLSITSGQSLQFQATATTASGGDWLVVSPTFGTTNQVALTVSLNATRLPQLTAGTYAGTISIAAAGAANTPHTIPVTLNVSGSTLINVNPAQLEFNTQAGQTPLAQSFAVTSTDNSNQAFNITVDPPSTSWLIISPTSGFTGSTGVLVNVNVNPGGLAAGTYDATIVVTPASVAGAVPQRLPVKLNILGSATVTANPNRVDFSQTGALRRQHRPSP
jgi:hypothetical protein